MYQRAYESIELARTLRAVEAEVEEEMAEALIDLRDVLESDEIGFWRKRTFVRAMLLWGTYLGLGFGAPRAWQSYMRALPRRTIDEAARCVLDALREATAQGHSAYARAVKTRFCWRGLFTLCQYHDLSPFEGPVHEVEIAWVELNEEAAPPPTSEREVVIGRWCHWALVRQEIEDAWMNALLESGQLGGEDEG